MIKKIRRQATHANGFGEALVINARGRDRRDAGCLSGSTFHLTLGLLKKVYLGIWILAECIQ